MGGPTDTTRFYLLCLDSFSYSFLILLCSDTMLWALAMWESRFSFLLFLIMISLLLSSDC